MGKHAALRLSHGAEDEGLNQPKCVSCCVYESRCDLIGRLIKVLDKKFF